MFSRLVSKRSGLLVNNSIYIASGSRILNLRGVNLFSNGNTRAVTYCRSRALDTNQGQQQIHSTEEHLKLQDSMEAKEIDSLESQANRDFARQKLKEGFLLTGERDESSMIGLKQENCSGCGVKFQNVDESAPGFLSVALSVIGRSWKDKLYASDSSQGSGMGKAMEEYQMWEDLDRKSSVNGVSAVEEFSEDMSEEEMDLEMVRSLVGKEKAKVSENDSLLCSRCCTLRYRSAEGDSFSQSKLDYKSVLESLLTTKAIVVKVVDLTDLKGTFFSDLQSFVNLEPMSFSDFVDKNNLKEKYSMVELGKMREKWAKFNTKSQHEVVLLANKVDVLLDLTQGKSYVNFHKLRIKSWLKKHTIREGLPEDFFSQIHLVSAKSHYGLDDAIKGIEKIRRGRNVVMVGCVSVGKSSLMNVFGSSNFYNIEGFKSPSLKKGFGRITTSDVPGTTLKSLSFPIKPPKRWVDQDSSPGWIWDRKALMVDTPGILPLRPRPMRLVSMLVDKKISNWKGDPNLLKDSVDGKEGMITKWRREFEQISQYNSIVHLLKSNEMKDVLLTKAIKPELCVLRKGETLLIGGVGRLDYIGGDAQSVSLVLFTNPAMVKHRTSTCKADHVYEKHVGTRVLSAPYFWERERLAAKKSAKAKKRISEMCEEEMELDMKGGEERRALFPPLIGEEFEFLGVDGSKVCGDVVFSAVGWVGVSCGKGHRVKMIGYSPGGIGLYSRETIHPDAISEVRQKRKKGAGPKVNGGLFGKQLRSQRSH